VLVDDVADVVVFF